MRCCLRRAGRPPFTARNSVLQSGNFNIATARDTCLLRLGSGLNACDDLRRRMQRSLERDGTVLDSASEELRRLRSEIATLERRLQRSLEDLLKNSDLSEVIQERFVTIRNGRYVIPVRRDARSQLPGLIHDHSNSGQTVFLEPSITLPMGNELPACLGNATK